MSENTLLSGRYEPVTLTGEGGTAQVYLCRDRRLGRFVAAKRVKNTNLSAVEALERERDILLSLSHPQIACVLDYFTEGDYWYLITTLAPGENAEKGQKRRSKHGEEDGKGAWEKRVIDWGIQICGILEYLHQRKPPVIYGDLKPANLMIDAQGEVFLVDFGSAIRLHPGKKRGKMLTGTAGYAAPEQYAGEAGEPCPASDLYALGATLKILLAGTRPSRGLALILKRCMNRDPKKRFSSARTVRILLQILAFIRR